MALKKLALPPDQSGYTFKDGAEAIAVQLSGGAPRVRTDILNAVGVVNVTWTCGPESYLYLRSFYRSAVANGSGPFLIDLILNSPEPVEHEARFVPDSMQLAGQSGLTYTVSASLYVVPKPIDDTSEDYVALFEDAGTDWANLEALFDYLVNTYAPAVLGNLLDILTDTAGNTLLTEESDIIAL